MPIASAGSYTVLVTANSTVPGTVVMVSASNISSDGFTLWINRKDNATTTLMWMMLAR
ncbi:hypothetical protein [Streptomyces sp. NPDC047009]|uniref:hypothetical protein n=1 Tax=unclassified Streptomyces TaxID=2593676 RepID=UPI00340F30EF